MVSLLIPLTRFLNLVLTQLPGSVLPKSPCMWTSPRKTVNTQIASLHPWRSLQEVWGAPERARLVSRSWGYCWLCPALRVALTWLFLTPLLRKEVLFPFPFYIGESLSLTFTNERQHDYTNLFWVHSPKLCQANFVDFIAIVHTVWCDREKNKTKTGSLIFAPLKSKLFSLPVCLKDFLIL